MKISEAWLRTYVNPPISTQTLISQLTMAGLEVGSVEPAAGTFSGVVVGEVLSMQQHPDADRLRVCQVDAGKDEPLQIVCGASNVRPGLKIPAALDGAVLPGNFKIKKSRLRGVDSYGMLCSEKELGLALEANGLMELANDAPVGTDIRDYLLLNDSILELELTPNRADCLSVEGIAREVAVLNKMDWSQEQVLESEITLTESLKVNVHATDACPRYLGRLIKGVNNKAKTPFWMQERLRRSGLRSLTPLVDVTNYVLLELGQPLHVFDADKLTGNITVRLAKANEELALLNGQVINVDDETLVIADDKQALALAGIMGGSSSAVNEDTQNVFLECAFFTPQHIAGKARKYGLHTDSSHRFERGVDPSLQKRAIERASQLIQEISCGSVGVITEASCVDTLPLRQPIALRRQRVQKMLGMPIPDETIIDLLHRLGMKIEEQAEGWCVTPPGFRFDMSIEVDLIEEIARLYGYNNLPNTSLLMRSQLGSATEATLDLERVKDLLVDRGYQEAITYSFVDESLQKIIAPNDVVIRLTNPISNDLAVMRTSLCCGLISAALHNTHRQQTRVRLFESGLRFIQKDGQTLQQKMISGLALGSVHDEQWGEKSRKLDFFDVKADVQAIFALTSVKVQFVAFQQAGLHPGQSAEILTDDGQRIGWIGMLHPAIESKLGFDTQVFLFELEQEFLLKKNLAQFKSLSKYPSVRRDLALVVNNEVTTAQIIDCIKSCNEPKLQDIAIFDIYSGKGVADGCKSVALSLIMQDNSQTLTDSEIDAIFKRVLETLNNNINAKLRD